MNNHDTLPPLPVMTTFMWLFYTADQMREYAAAAVAAERERCAEMMERQHTWISSVSASRLIRGDSQVLMTGYVDEPAAAVAEPVASVTECEACFTQDVCQLRGTCDHYAAERLRVAAPPQREPLMDEQIYLMAKQQKINPWGIGSRLRDTLDFARAIERAHGIAPASAPKEQP